MTRAKGRRKMDDAMVKRIGAMERRIRDLEARVRELETELKIARRRGDVARDFMRMLDVHKRGEWRDAAWLLVCRAWTGEVLSDDEVRRVPVRERAWAARTYAETAPDVRELLSKLAAMPKGPKRARETFALGWPPFVDPHPIEASRLSLEEWQAAIDAWTEDVGRGSRKWSTIVPLCRKVAGTPGLTDVTVRKVWSRCKS